MSDSKEPTPKKEIQVKLIQSVLDTINQDYMAGNYKSIRELAMRHNVNYIALLARVTREKWEEQRQKKLKELQSKMDKKVVNVSEEYLRNVYERAKKYERLIDASMENFGSKDVNGQPLLDPDAINSYSLSESRIHEIAKSALRIPDAKSVDLTSGGKSIGDSIVGAIERLRNAGTAVTITEAQVEQLADYEVIPDAK